MESEGSTKNTSKKRSSTPKSPADTLNSTIASFTSSNHDAILNNVATSKKKRGKRKKKNTPSNVIKKRKQTKTKSRKTVTKSNLNLPSNLTPDDITNNAIQGFDAPGHSYDATVKSNVSGTHVMGIDKEIPNNILRTDEGQTQDKVHNENVQISTKVGHVSVQWEHFSLLVEEYLLAIDVKM